jgi:hypothetical protein
VSEAPAVSPLIGDQGGKSSSSGFQRFARNVQTIAHIGRQQVVGKLDVLGNHSRVVDHDIPLAAAQSVQLTIPVADQRLYVRHSVRAVFATIEMCHPPAKTQRLAREMRTDESGSA